MSLWSMTGSLLSDLRFGLRTLMRSPGFATVAIVTLALGIATNATVFTLVSSLLMQELPYPESDNLYLVRTQSRNPEIDRAPICYPDFEAWKAGNTVFTDIAVFTEAAFNLSADGVEPEKVTGATGSSGLLEIMGVAPARGRWFLPEEDRPGANHVVILSDRLWRHRFGADPEILGRTIRLNAQPHTVVGVMPPAFAFPDNARLWTPLGLEPTDVRNNYFLDAIARLRPGVDRTGAQGAMDAIAHQLGEEHPADNAERGFALKQLREDYVKNVRPALAVFMVAVACVLLIACANVSSLLLARAVARTREMAIRTALGATRSRLVRQLLTEGAVVAVAACGLGLLLSIWGVDMLVAGIQEEIPERIRIVLDWRVVVFTAGVSLLSVLFFSLAPSLHAARADMNDTLKEGGRGTEGGVSRRRMRHALIVAEVALSIVLLVGAFLMIRSFRELRRVDPGFAPEGVMTMRISLPSARYGSPDQRRQFYTQVLERVAAIPGVRHAALTLNLPMSNGTSRTTFDVEGRDWEPGTRVYATRQTISPDFFQAVGMRIMKGRSFTAQDGPGANVVIVDETFATRMWPGEEALGKRIQLGTADPNNSMFTVVGIVNAVRQYGLREEPPITYYLPVSRVPQSDLTLLASTPGDPAALALPMRAAVLEVDNDQPTFDAQTLQAMLARSIWESRLSGLLLSVFALLALGLAVVGLYGAMSYTVSQRTHELGIRIALGADRGTIVRLVVGQGLRLTLAGVVLGLLASLGLARLMSGLLFGISTLDPLTYLSVPLLLSAVALAACYVPARRATRVDPMIALRQG